MTGSLQIKNGKYYTVINVKDINGNPKKKWKTTGLDVKGNKKRAEKILRERIKEYETKENLIKTDVLFCDYVLHYLELAKIKVDTITYQGYECIAKSHIIPYFKETKTLLTELKREDIQRYINVKFENGRLDGKGGLSPKSVKTHMIIIQQAVKEALKSNLILTNPCEFVTLPKMQRHEPNFYTVQQIKELFEAIKDEPMYSLVYFTVIFGLRRSEVLGLKWDSVNLEANIITIKHTVVRFSEVVEKDQTKTNASYRSYPLSDDIIKILSELKAKENENRRLFGAEYIENDYIFKWDNGKPYAPDYISRKFSKLLTQNDLPHIRFHDLRHSCASLLVANGFNIKDIQEWLGHADIQTTANIYAHLDNERKKNIALSMSNSFAF